MGRLSENYELGSNDDLTQEELFSRIQEMYTQLARAINQKADLVVRDVDGVATDVFLSEGTININTTTDNVQILTNHTSTTNVTWTNI